MKLNKKSISLTYEDVKFLLHVLDFFSSQCKFNLRVFRKSEILVNLFEKNIVISAIFCNKFENFLKEFEYEEKKKEN